jgi:hypothetical protein
VLASVADNCSHADTSGYSCSGANAIVSAVSRLVRFINLSKFQSYVIMTA